jgi:hypothetical protein
MASIAFNDGSAATLTNGKPAPLDRFANWTPDVDPIGPRDTALGTGIDFHWNFRTDYLASLELPYISPADHAVALRLKKHLETGGTATLTTGDGASNVYTVRIAPGTRVQLEYADRAMVEYTLKLTVKNTAAAPLVCLY